MERIEKTVFLSYRRTNFPWALAIFQSLTHDGFDVFFDYIGIASGDFERVIIENITARAHFLVLLTPSALERCGEPEDWLRREIETALDSKRNVVPLLLEGFDFRSPRISTQLTGALAVLNQYNGLSIPREYFFEAMNRLRDRYLNVPLTAVLHPASLYARQVAIEQKAAAEAVPAVKEEELTAQQWFERGFEATDLDEKLRFYNQAIRLDPNAVGAFNNRGKARCAKGDLEGALRDYNEAIRLRRDNANIFYNRGSARGDNGEMNGALNDYNEAIRLKPDFVEAFNNRGVTRRNKGDLDGALKDFNEAIRLKPDHVEAFINRGATRRDKGDLDGALEDYNEAIRLKPDAVVAFNNRGVARRAQGNSEGALEDYSQAIRHKPDYAEAFNNRGNVRCDKGDMEGALNDYSEAIRLKADYAEAFINRGNARRDKGDMKGALEDHREATRLGFKQKN